VYAEWRRRSGVADGEEPAMGDPGGGSDFAGFYNHLGIPHADWGFGGPGGVYHSQYDSYDFVRRFADPTFAYHAAAARVNAALLLRLANADVLPYDYVEFARTMRRYLPAVERAAAARRLGGVSPAPLAASIDRMERAAQAFAGARDAALAGTPAPPAARLRAANEALKRVEKALTRPQGLRTRPWFRNLVYAADENNGYANVVFPSVSEAVRDGDATRAAAEIADLASRFDAATRAIEEATRALGARSDVHLRPAGAVSSRVAGRHSTVAARGVTNCR
jgi:N-acetylated-alpha-linked acidic dipeptidase